MFDLYVYIINIFKFLNIERFLEFLIFIVDFLCVFLDY